MSIDLSVEMMRRGRERLAADSRLVFRDQAGFVASRGQSLPFVAESFDGVLCMNALHHLPSYGAALARDSSRAQARWPSGVFGAWRRACRSAAVAISHAGGERH